jgi:hypothetical protein
MNNKDKKDLDLILYRLSEQDEKRLSLEKAISREIIALKKQITKDHEETRKSLRFIKDNLFNPDSGLWAETRLNSTFRKSATRALWLVVPSSIFAVLKIVWDYVKKV